MSDDDHSSKQKKPSRLKKLLKFALAAFALFIIALVIASYAIDYAYVLVPPELASTPEILSHKLLVEGGITRLDGNWLEKKDGLLRMRLEGDPFELGYANARLTQEYIKQQETEFLDVIRSFVSDDWKLWLLKKFIVVRNRGLDTCISREHLIEIYGLSLGYEDPFPEIGPLYHRLVNYHAAHDIGHALIDNPLIGCTSFAAGGPYTADGHLWLGRNFDFDAARCFDENKIVMLFEPDEGLSFISVGWPGLIGVVTGLNEERIFAAVNAARSADKKRIGTPVSLVLRKVMQEAASLEEAIEIIRTAEVFVTDSYLVADGETGRAAIVEKTPARCSVVEMREEFLVSANHFLSKELASDAANQRQMDTGTTMARYNRMEDLVEQYKGRLDAATIARIMRDRSVAGIGEAGLGNEASISGLVATHSVIVDLTAGVLYVSVSPHQLGAYVPFSLSLFDKPTSALAIPADDILSDGRYEAYLLSREKLAAARKCLDGGDSKTAAELAAQAADGNPGHWEPYLLLGEAALAAGDPALAVKHLEAAQSAWPPFKSERDEVATLLVKARASAGP